MIKGRNIDNEVFAAGNRTVFDLSGAAASEMVLYNQTHEIRINKIWVHYEEATSANAGVIIKIGSKANDDAYFTATSEINKSAYDCKEYNTGDMVLATVPIDTPIYVAHAGSKTGTGDCYVWFSYTVL